MNKKNYQNLIDEINHESFQNSIRIFILSKTNAPENK